jgi:hypothetical protein
MIDMPQRATSTSFGAERGNQPGRLPGPLPGKRKVAAEQREAALRLAVNGPPPLFEGDAVDYYRRVLSGEIPVSEQQRMLAADKLLPIDMKIREQKLAAEAELIQAARVKAWTSAHTAPAPVPQTPQQQQLDALLANPLPEEASDAEIEARIAELTRLKALVEKD